MPGIGVRRYFGFYDRAPPGHGGDRDQRYHLGGQKQPPPCVGAPSITRANRLVRMVLASIANATRKLQLERANRLMRDRVEVSGTSASLPGQQFSDLIFMLDVEGVSPISTSAWKRCSVSKPMRWCSNLWPVWWLRRIGTRWRRYCTAWLRARRNPNLRSGIFSAKRLSITTARP